MSFPSNPSVAILFGMPTSRARFFEKANDLAWDYGRPYLAGSSPESAWAKYSSVADVAVDLIAQAKRHGVAVTTDANLADVESSSRFADIMIIVAHWKGHLVAEADLFADAVERVLDQSEVTDPLVRRVALSLKRRISSDERLVSRQLLTRELNQEIATESERLGSEISGAGRELIAAFARSVIDEAFSSILAPGNRLELNDGLHAPELVEHAVDSDYRGLIDFACCTSDVLTTCFKHVRGDSVRVLFSRGQLYPVHSMPLIREAISVMYSTGAAYAETKLDLERAVRDRLSHRH